MQTRNKGSGLPEEYQIKCQSTKEWIDLINTKAAPLGNRGGGHKSGGSENGYYIVKDQKWWWINGKQSGIPEVQYDEWKALLTGEAEEFKVGNYIVIKNDGCRYGHNSKKVKEENTYKISKKGTNLSYDWSYELEGIEGAGIAGYNNQLNDYIRHATPEEITKAGGIVDVWKVGDVLPIEWLTKTHTYTAKNGRKQSLQTYWSKSHKVSIADADGWAKIGDTDTWLPPKHLCTPLPEIKKEVLPWGIGDKFKFHNNPTGQGWEIIKVSGDTVKVQLTHDNGTVSYSISEVTKFVTEGKWIPLIDESKASKNGKDWICTSEDGVKLYDGDHPTWVLTLPSTTVYEIASPCQIRVAHLKDIQKGTWKVFSTKAAAEAWIEAQNNHQIPVTKGQVGNVAKIGQNATGYAEKYRGQWGEIVKMNKGCWYDLKMSDEEIVTCYPSEIEEIKSSQTINSQIKTKSNDKENTKQKDRHSAIYVCTDHQVISKRERRAATPVSGGGCTGLIKGTHKVHRKAVSC